MNIRTKGLVGATLAGVVASLATVPTQPAVAGTGHATHARSAAWRVHSVETAALGVAHPRGIAWDAASGTLLVTGRNGGSTIRMTPAGRGRAATAPRASRVSTARTTSAPDGTRYALRHGTVVRTTPDGAVSTVRIHGIPASGLRGLAWQPQTQELYVADPAAGRLYTLDGSGAVVGSRDLTDAQVGDLTAMTFAPSSDPTDPASELSLYVADGGAQGQLGGVTELSLAAQPQALPASATVAGSIVKSTATTAWTPDSPDPASVTYLPDSGKLLVSDSEVEETALYQGVNLWTSTLAGQGTASGTTLTDPATHAWSDEPTGVAYDNAGKRLFVSDDDKRSVFEIDSAGTDGAFGTADDAAPTSFKVNAFGATDPEDVAYDSKRNELLVIDGVGMELYRINPGPDHDFSTTADNVVTHSDVEHLGVIDPEAVGYDPVRDTVLVADDKDIFELAPNGSLLNVVDLPTSDVFAISGVTVAPASNGIGRSYYVTDRGKDNQEVPGENDGRLLEVSASLPAITNLPPHVSAGADQVVQLPAAAQLSGTATDDSKPGPMSYTWSMTSGTGTATFSAPHALQTSATFSAAGTYVLRLTATDSQLSDYDELTVTVYNPGQTRTVSLPIAASADDAQEGGGQQGNTVRIDSPDDELGNDGTIDQYSQQLKTVLTGLRFANVPVPPGGRVLSATIQFTVDEKTTDPTPAAFTIRGEAADNAAAYAAVRGNISGRTSTAASVPWSPPAWTTLKEAGPAEATPDLTSIVQQIIGRPGWKQGNALAFMFSGAGRRTAGAYDGLFPAPVLTLQYQVANTAPVVDAGPDQTIQLPAGANLQGVVTDDKLPTPPGATTLSWTKLSGPGTVTFATPTAAATAATFSQAGTYVLQLMASDSQLTGTDTVTITVEPADAPPVVDAGADQVVTLPGSATLTGTVVSAGYPGTMAGVATTWSKVSGPGTVTFGSSNALSTTASFSDPGLYDLRLTGSNGSTLTGTDDVVVTVQPADLTVSLQPSTANLVAGKRLTLRGLVTRAADGAAASGQQVRVLAYAAPRYRERALGTLPVGEDGSFSITDQPKTTTRYVARAENGDTMTVVVKVRPRLTGRFTHATVRRHRSSYLHGYVAPSASGQTLLLQRRSHGHWVTVARKKMHAAAKAGYRFRVRENRVGRYQFRVVAPAYRGRAQAVTPSLRLTVRR